MNIQFTALYEYTNYSVTVFNLNLKSNETDKAHDVRIYRFWGYDKVNDIPCESAYFIKMLRTINFFNPIYKKVSKFGQIGNYPKNQMDVANYLIHSESTFKLYTFLLYDHTSDEFRLTDRFCIENSFKKLNDSFKAINNLEEEHLQKERNISLDAYLFCYLNGMCTMNTNNDTFLNALEGHHKNILRIGLITKKAIINDHFTVRILYIYMNCLVNLRTAYAC